MLISLLNVLNKSTFKRFALNFRQTNYSNLWGFCTIDMNLIVLSLSEQHVTFSIEVNQTKFFVEIEYASNSHVI